MAEKEKEPPNNERPQQAKQSFGSFLGRLIPFVGAVAKWQRTLTAERRQKIRALFTVPRNDPNDPFKPNSEIQVKKISELPFKEGLPDEEEDMLQTVAVHYDHCLPLDIIEWRHPLSELSDESLEQMEKLPTWLKALIFLRYDKILEFFGPRTHLFLRMLANRVDFQRSIPMKIFEMDDNDDEEDYYTISKNFVMTDDDIDATLSFMEAKKPKQSIQGQDLFRVMHAIVLWKLPKSARAEWAPNVVHRSAITLRRAMLTQASPTEIAMVDEDDKLNVLSDESEEEDLYKPLSWQEIISEKPEFKEKIKKNVEEDFNKVPHQFQKLGEDVAPKVRRRRELQSQREELEKRLKKERTLKERWRHNKIFVRKKARQTKKLELINRGLFRKYSRIWYKNCPMQEIGPTKRRAHHYRYDEGFHAYVAALVSSHMFKMTIMTIIVFNAVVLGIETAEVSEKYVDVFEMLDNFFLSIYLTEFIVKFYAHPKRYWKSGFNVFDSIILLVSFIKAVADWFSLAEVQLLRVLVIVRALRVLRGVSVSVQIQVLVTAMVETLKTHVLSVLILLVLVMYISAIMAFYFFGEIVPKDWGNIGIGMLKLFAFVTMDGWTDLLDSFADKDHLHSGRFFCLAGIVLGNFIFSNIFIAIIIMQISEATDAYRLKVKQERESIVKRKKETVFRRQKLDMRQLLARQKLSTNVDFYYLASQFQRLLRHDDLVDMRDMMCSPMWIDCVNKCSQRCLHTGNMLMNLHREAADALLGLYHHYNDPTPKVKGIRRARMNRCVQVKAKLIVLKNEFYRSALARKGEGDADPRRLKLRLPKFNRSFTSTSSISPSASKTSKSGSKRSWKWKQLRKERKFRSKTMKRMPFTNK